MAFNQSFICWIASPICPRCCSEEKMAGHLFLACSDALWNSYHTGGHISALDVKWRLYKVTHQKAKTALDTAHYLHCRN